MIWHYDTPKQEAHDKAVALLKEVGIEDAEKRMKQYPHQLSGGMRQRVMIAAAMVGDPQLLIADEATTALDVTVQAQIIKLLQKINKESQVAILFISHDLSLIRQISHNVLVMQNGHLVEKGAVDDIFENPKQEYTRKLIAAIPKVEL
jgi:ABC-type dipeptide/oligopeptide/nickel transport system ATPase component